MQALLVGMLLVAAQPGQAALQADLEGDPLFGAQIYDNWILALDLHPPEGDHPLWDDQDFNRRGGVITWRCSECHGWDYKGAEGAFGPYSTHYTGFPSLDRAIGASHREVLGWLNGSQNSDHNFLALTNATALNDLAAFLRTQQIDMDLLIDPNTGASLGNSLQGRELYMDSCAACHGAGGDVINFGSAGSPMYLGDLAVAEPWQTMHKIRFGTPTTSRMPAYENLDWSLRMMNNVLAYAQTLPRGNPDYRIIRFDADQSASTEQQAQMEPIVWASAALIVLLGLNVAWDLYLNRKAK